MWKLDVETISPVYNTAFSRGFSVSPDFLLINSDVEYCEQPAKYKTIEQTTNTFVKVFLTANLFFASLISPHYRSTYRPKESANNYANLTKKPPRSKEKMECKNKDADFSLKSPLTFLNKITQPSNNLYYLISATSSNDEHNRRFRFSKMFSKNFH